MKKTILITGILFCSILSIAQTTFKANKPVSNTNWLTIQKLLASSGTNDYAGTLQVMDEKGIVYKVTGDRPANPGDRISWRPPIIPPLVETQNQQVPVTKNRSGKKAPKPLDPGCPTCSILIVYGQLNDNIKNEINKVFMQDIHF